LKDLLFEKTNREGKINFIWEIHLHTQVAILCKNLIKLFLDRKTSLFIKTKKSLAYIAMHVGLDSCIDTITIDKLNWLKWKGRPLCWDLPCAGKLWGSSRRFISAPLGEKGLKQNTADMGNFNNGDLYKHRKW